MESNKESQEFKDEFIESVLINADPQTLESDFDRNLMKTLETSYNHKKEVRTKLKRSAMYIFGSFFLIAVCAGYNLIFHTTANRFVFASIVLLFIVTVMSVLLSANYRRFLQHYDF